MVRLPLDHTTTFQFITGTIVISHVITVQAQDMGACIASRPTTKAMTLVGYDDLFQLSYCMCNLEQLLKLAALTHPP